MNSMAHETKKKKWPTWYEDNLIRNPEKKMGYDSAISTVFQMQLYFQNLGINSTQKSSASRL